MAKRASNADKSGMFLAYWRLLAQGESEPVSEYNFDRALGRKHRFDWAFVDSRVAVEIDGGSYAVMGGRHATDADREKLNIAASLHWLVFRFSPQQLKRDPAGCVEIVLQTVRDMR